MSSLINSVIMRFPHENCFALCLPLSVVSPLYGTAGREDSRPFVL